MPNVLTNRTIYIVSTMGSSYQTARALPEPQPLRVIGVKLIGSTTSANTASITEPTSGDVLINMSAPENGVDVTMFPQVQVWRDFVATLGGSGTCTLLIFTV